MYPRLLKGDLSGTDALTASQQMLQILMDSMANAVFWKDLQSRYLGCNKVFASFAGVEPSLLIGMSDRDMPWADSAEFSADWFIDWDQKIILLSVTASLNPTLIAATTVMLLLERPSRLMLGYLLGAYMTSITLGLVIVFSLSNSSTTNTTETR